MANEISANVLREFKFTDDAVTLTHSECGVESPYFDCPIEAVEWMRGHICKTQVLTITEFAQAISNVGTDGANTPN